MDRKKLIERVRKLLAMSQDTSSPQEAAIAARRVRHLMLKHNIDNVDVLLKGLTEDDIEKRTHDFWRKRFPLHLNFLAVGVSEYTDTQFILSRRADGAKAITFRGEKSDIEIAEYLFIFLRDAIERGAKAHPIAGRSAKTQFKKGMAIELQRRLGKNQKEDAEIVGSKTALVVRNRKKDLIERKYGKVKTSTVNVDADSSYFSGQRAGRNLAINPALNSGGKSQRRLI